MGWDHTHMCQPTRKISSAGRADAAAARTGEYRGVGVSLRSSFRFGITYHELTNFYIWS
jgi:hypothetical protein